MKLVPNNVDDLEKVYSNVRRELGGPPKRRHGTDRRQHDHLGNIYVRDSEGSGTSWIRLSRKPTYHQEHGLRQDQTSI